MVNIKKDALGVTSAVFLKSTDFDLLSGVSIRRVCVAVINRYNKSAVSAALVSKAAEILDGLKGDYWVMRVSDLKRLSDSLIIDEPEEAKDEKKER